MMKKFLLLTLLMPGLLLAEEELPEKNSKLSYAAIAGERASSTQYVLACILQSPIMTAVLENLSAVKRIVPKTIIEHNAVFPVPADGPLGEFVESHEDLSSIVDKGELTVASDGETVTLHMKTSDSSTAKFNERGKKFLQEKMGGKPSRKDTIEESDKHTQCTFTQECTFNPESQQFTMKCCSYCTTQITPAQLKAMMRKERNLQ